MIDRIEAANEAVSIYDLLAERGQVVDSARPRKVFCPVHDDRNKSAVTYPESNEIYCFTCRQTYDPVGLLVAEGMSHAEACESIERGVGVVWKRRSRPEDKFWSLMRDHEKRRAGDVVSRREAFRLRWEIHRTVLELAEGPVDWEPFDTGGLDIGILRDWQEGALRGRDSGAGRLAGYADGGGSARAHSRSGVADDQGRADPV